eukprot:TRINITY_DN2623_c1_g1_i1.p1 TRINITY_DN2623_c1_g1~~TRINITY_DN2623_c1_g1_i1.p1  ORF type:complete len:639 (-),score=157.27 TRINITY_DN2623_c1_g1_i1:88-2004(-)
MQFSQDSATTANLVAFKNLTNATVFDTEPARDDKFQKRGKMRALLVLSSLFLIGSLSTMAPTTEDGVLTQQVAGMTEAATPSFASISEMVLLSVRKQLAQAREASASKKGDEASEHAAPDQSNDTLEEKELSCQNSKQLPDMSSLMSEPAHESVEAADNSGLEESEALTIGLEETEDEALFIDETEEETQQEEQKAPPAGPLTISLVKEHVSTESVGNTLYYKSAYWGTIMVGNPPQPFSLIFDTGSGHLILPSAYCQSEACKVHSRYRRSKSTTAVDVNTDGTEVEPGQPRDQLSVSFGTGEVSGVFVKDEVCFQDSKATPALTSEGELVDPHAEPPRECFPMNFIAATEMSEDPFKGFVFDGIMGMGLSSLSQTAEFNFMHVLSQHSRMQNSPHAKTFAIFLAQHTQEESEISLGGWENNRLQQPEDLKWNTVLEPEMGHWLIEVKSISVDGEKLDFCRDGCKGVVDSGTSLVSVPTKVFPEVYEMLRHSPDEDGFCDGEGPKLQIELEGLTITLDPTDYAHLMETAPKSTPRWGFSATQTPEGKRRDKFCKPLFMAMDFDGALDKLFILGEPVLKKYYTVYDGENERVGFGLAQHVAESPPAEPEAEDAWWYEAEEELEQEMPTEESETDEVPAE